jgi:hypothetical protein
VEFQTIFKYMNEMRTKGVKNRRSWRNWSATIGHTHKIFGKGLGENFGGLGARLTDHSLSQLSYRPRSMPVSGASLL